MQPLKGTPAQGLFGATLGFFVGFAAVALFGVTAARFKEAMDLSPLAVGFLVAAPSLSGSLLRIPFAAWVDITGGRKPFLTLLALSLVGMIGLWAVIHFLYPAHLTPGLYPLIFILGLFCGCGIATFSVGIAQVSYWHPQAKQGRALGIYAGVGNLAPGVFSFILPLAIASLGLAGSYLAWLAFLAAGTILYFLTGRNSWYFQLRQQGLDAAGAKTEAARLGQQIFPKGSTLDSLRISARVWQTWPLVAIYFTTFGGFIALTAWFPTYWHEGFGLAAKTAGFLTAAYSIAASLMRVFGGLIADRFGGEKTALISLVVTLAGAILLTVADIPAFAFAAAMVMAVGMGVCNAAVFKLVPQNVPQAVGGAAGWVGGLGAFGGFAIPPTMSLFVRQFGQSGYALGFIVFAAMAVASIALALWLRAAHAKTPRNPNDPPQDLPKRGDRTPPKVAGIGTPINPSSAVARPIVLSCSGCSFAGQFANQLAVELDKRGLAQMSCLAGVGAQRPNFLKLIASREVWLIDGCPIQCGQGILDLTGRQPDRHIRLHDLGIPKNAPPNPGINLDQIIETISSRAAQPA